MTDTTKIAFLGTGLMGGHMARNLAQAGHPVTAWNRTRAKAEPLAAHGVTVADSAGEAVDRADLVISILADGPTTAQVMRDVADHLRDGAVWVDMCSSKPEEARAQEAMLAEHGVAQIDAPVSGGTRGADEATLAIMAGGDAAAFARVAPVLKAMGRPVHVGPAGSGQLAKLANQAIVGVTIGVVAEAMLLLQKGGADPAAVRAALKGGFADSIVLQQHGARMTEGDFDPGGLSRLQLKDLDNVLHEARTLGLSLPQVAGVRDRFHHFVHDMDGADRDHSGLYLELLARQD
ncbi:NAD(P)-dependent oxidoreductase [Pseudaestuariivita atlantica]|uniref:2-hydroxy-3-oxopropionate reductase n=1 Tax=Pseudaestuariivita atlantica TaxID=1317121 RepID=A0A0L1JVB1_9RHOB|nr:NAD(P)-dependent oxidoreductase [Pseudaestuariivita atlantica]KNG95632.1 2-hydroxy-3-oxopropionate reductase [Pseudaestuariivita atlantica]